MFDGVKYSQSGGNKKGDGPFHGDAPNLHVYGFSVIEEATNNFSYENKLGEGGYGPVYKVTSSQMNHTCVFIVISVFGYKFKLK